MSNGERAVACNDNICAVGFAGDKSQARGCKVDVLNFAAKSDDNPLPLGFVEKNSDVIGAMSETRSLYLASLLMSGMGSMKKRDLHPRRPVHLLTASIVSGKESLPITVVHRQRCRCRASGSVEQFVQQAEVTQDIARVARYLDAVSRLSESASVKREVVRHNSRH